MVANLLDDLREKFPDCDTLAFADLSTKMILVTNTDTKLRREALDKLCTEAALTLGSAKKPAFGDTKSTTAFVASKDQVRIFIRAAQEPTDVLCCVCSVDVDISAFIADAVPCLENISGG